MIITAEITNRRALTTFGRRPLPPGVESAVSARISVDGVPIGYVRLIGGPRGELFTWGDTVDWAEAPIIEWLSRRPPGIVDDIVRAVQVACDAFDASEIIDAYMGADEPEPPLIISSIGANRRHFAVVVSACALGGVLLLTAYAVCRGLG